jgi:hypothetical protein
MPNYEDRRLPMLQRVFHRLFRRVQVPPALQMKCCPGRSLLERSNMQIPNRLFSMTRLRYLVTPTVLMLAMFPLLHANILTPGDITAPDEFPDPGNPPILGHTSGTFTIVSGSALLTGNYDEFVLVDPFGLACAGCLDFAFFASVEAPSNSSISFLYLTGFAGYTTDVGEVRDGIDPGLVGRSPLSVDGGGDISFNFVPSTLVGPGQSTDGLVVITNATMYTNLGAAFFNPPITGTGATGPNGRISTGLFVPVAAPEPASWALMLAGVAALVAMRGLRRLRND